MKDKLYCGRGENIAFCDLMDMLNLTYGHTPPEQDFRTLLPKLYREELRPQNDNYVVIENGALVAAVGAYDHELKVCGRTLHCRGIGNVAVHPDHRSKGYMNLAMDATMRDMAKDGVALSTLGGKRQRYQYFGYDKTGTVYYYSISNDNMRHVFGGVSSPFTIREITAPADPVIDKIIALNESSPFIPVRPRSLYLYVANTWKARLLAIEDGERFVGYAVLNRKTVSEIDVVGADDFIPSIRSLFAFIGESYTIKLPPHQFEFRKALTPFAENVSSDSAMQFNVFDYRKVTEAFLALKLTYTDLPDGQVTMLIHGFAGDERICIAVENGKPVVTAIGADTPVDCELSHEEALSFLFSHFSTIRENATDTARLFFPLPIYMYHSDEV